MIFVADAIVYRCAAAAWLMLAAPVFLWLFWQLTRQREGVLKDFLGTVLHKRLTVARSSKNYQGRAGCLVLAWLLGTLSLMQPEYQRVREPQTFSEQIETSKGREAPMEGAIQRKPMDVIFLLDASASMNVVDTPTGQTRLEFAKDLIADTITRLTGDNIGLDVFTTEVKQLVPPTLDHLYLRMLLRDVHVNETRTPGTDFRRVLNFLRQNLWGKLSDKMNVLVVVSDGGDTELESLPKDQQAAYIKVILSGFGDIDASHRRVFTIGVGSTQGQTVPGVEQAGKPVRSALMDEFLRQLAVWGSGVYLDANNYEGLGLSEELASAIAEAEPKPKQIVGARIIGGNIRAPASPPPQELFYWPLLMGIFLLIASTLIPEVDEEEARAHSSAERGMP